MSDEIEFVDGLRVFKPHDNAPSFVKLNLTIDTVALKAWLAPRSGTVRLDVNESKGGKLYACVNQWKPMDAKPPQHKLEPEYRPVHSSDAGEFQDDQDIPF